MQVRIPLQCKRSGSAAKRTSAASCVSQFLFTTVISAVITRNLLDSAAYQCWIHHNFHWLTHALSSRKMCRKKKADCGNQHPKNSSQGESKKQCWIASSTHLFSPLNFQLTLFTCPLQIWTALCQRHRIHLTGAQLLLQRLRSGRTRRFKPCSSGGLRNPAESNPGYIYGEMTKGIPDSHTNGISCSRDC